MKFENDVFISYAHIDDESLKEGVKGWISEFHYALERRLAQILGEPAKIWRDAKLHGNDMFAPEIESQFPKLKIMISVVTPRYVKSEWCTKEVGLFHQAASTTGGVVFDNKSRIIKIVKTPVNLESQPEVMRPLLGYDFFKIDPETKRPRELGIQGKEEDIEVMYWTKLDDVAYDVAQLIEKLDSESIPSVSQPIKISSAGNTISGRKLFLAETSYDMKEYRDNLKRELEDKGFLIFPNKNIDPVGAIYRKEIDSMMKECSLSLHLVGSSYGLIPEGELKSILEIQNEIASTQGSGRGLSRLTWIPDITPSDDQRLIALVDQIKHKEEIHAGSDVLIGTIEEFKFTIFDTLKELDRKESEKSALNVKAVAAATNTSAMASEDPKIIYLLCDQRDLGAIQTLDDFLYDNGFEVRKSLFDGTQEELMKDHEDSLRDCDIALIYFGNSNEAWLRSKISELKRKPAFEGAKPLLYSMVYVAGPSSTVKETYRSREVNLVVKAMEGFNPELLNEFIQKIK